MSTQNVGTTATQPVTRRALREAERAVEQTVVTVPAHAPVEVQILTLPMGFAHAEPKRYPTRAERRKAALAADAGTPFLLEAPVEKIDPAAKISAFGTLVPVPAAATAAVADLVLEVGSEADPTSETASRRWVPRVALLGALGAVTIIAPLSGVAQPGSAAAAAATPTASASPALADAGPTVVEHLSAEGTAVQEASALAADPAAATRALTTASRSYQRAALECPVESGSNGTLGAVMGGEAPVHIVMPVADGAYRLTSDYGYRTYPFAGMHEGTDFAGRLGTPLHAVADGVVTYAGGPRDGRTGNIVVVKSEIDGQVVEFWYGHQYADGIHVSVGEEVVAGEVIGEIGNAGNSTGPHLHFEVHPGAGTETTDPLAWLRAHNAEPVSAAANC